MHNEETKEIFISWKEHPGTRLLMSKLLREKIIILESIGGGAGLSSSLEEITKQYLLNTGKVMLANAILEISWEDFQTETEDTDAKTLRTSGTD